jgi:hypothetical protein
LKANADGIIEDGLPKNYKPVGTKRGERLMKRGKEDFEAGTGIRLPNS